MDLIQFVGTYTAAYLQQYGMHAGIDTYRLPAKYKTAEELYKECIEQGKTWEQIVNNIPRDAIL
jgi:hypothetical protein